MKRKGFGLWSVMGRPRAGGFSLLEVMIAVALFSLASVGSLTTLAASSRVLGKTRERLYVGRVLESRLEEIRDLTFDEVDALPSTILFTVLPATTVFGKTINPSISDVDYQLPLQSAVGQVTIADMATDLKSVTVSVTWDSGTQGNRVTMKTMTYITRNGINRQ